MATTEMAFSFEGKNYVVDHDDLAGPYVVLPDNRLLFGKVKETLPLQYADISDVGGNYELGKTAEETTDLFAISFGARLARLA